MNKELVVPTKVQKAWQDYEVGVAFHFDMPVYLEKGWEWETAYRTVLDPSVYNPEKLNTDQWLQAAKNAGAQYAALTATHMGGFLQWQSDLYPYGVKQSPWKDGKGDVVKEFIDSCNKYNIKPVIFMSLRFNAYWQVSKQKVDFGKAINKQKQKKYTSICREMVKEIVSRYGNLAELWFDGGTLTPDDGGPELLSLIEKYQKNIVYYHSRERADHRWAGNEEGTAAYPCWATMPSINSLYTWEETNNFALLQHGDPNGKVWMPAMCDVPIRGTNGRHEWFWREGDDDSLYSVDRLVNMYYNSVGRNANLILSGSPNRDGLISEPDMKLYKEFGDEIRKNFSNKIGEVSGEGRILELDLKGNKEINQVVLMEDIEYGERIRSYKIEGLLPNDKWIELCNGISVGHKRIQVFDNVIVKKIRLACLDCIEKPRIRKFEVYFR